MKTVILLVAFGCLGLVLSAQTMLSPIECRPISIADRNCIVRFDKLATGTLVLKYDAVTSTRVRVENTLSLAFAIEITKPLERVTWVRDSDQKGNWRRPVLK